MVIASGERPNILLDLFSGKPHGTFFVPKETKIKSRKRWIGFTLKPKGVITVDEGAANAVLRGGKSLLPSGIIRVEGNFDVGAPVAIIKDGTETLGTGLVNYNAEEINKIKGLKSTEIKDRLGYKPYDEVIHRDNLVITNDD
jgi:glutamate 5-kinase